MLTMIGKRLMFAIPSLIGVVIVTFLLTRALPGDPAAYFAGPAATREAVEQIRKKLGFDKPLIEQFFRYTADLAHGDFGNSLTTGQPGATFTEIERKTVTPAQKERIIAMQCVPRAEVPEDLVGAALFLASEASAFVTGQSINLDGGVTGS